MDPWSVIGWMILTVVWGLVLICLIAALKSFFSALKRSRISKKAHAGKLECQYLGCTKIAEVRTQAGYFCIDDSRNVSRFASFSFSAPLDYRTKGVK